VDASGGGAPRELIEVNYEIEAGGRIRHVAVTRTGAGFAVTVDARTWNVDAKRIDAHTLSLLLDNAGDTVLADQRREGVKGGVPGTRSVRDGVPVWGWGPTRSKEVVVVRGRAPDQVTVFIDDTPITVSMNGHRRWSRGEHVGQAAASGPLRVIAPMPGKVVRVLVEVGEKVSSRQPLLVVEAMKMENELRASREGTVMEIHAREGMLVDAGALLAVVQ
jgi:biotin carboxyl carrier protein